jgi:hypothetical protein
MLDVKRRGGVAVDENYEIGGSMASAWREQAPSDLVAAAPNACRASGLNISRLSP